MAISKTNRVVGASLAMLMTFQFTACGTVFYPERKGQKGGRIDPVVAVANAIGLLFYFIPGVIAFAVDFTTGAIYLPRGRHSSLTPEELQSVSDGRGVVNKQALNAILTKKLGQPIDIEAASVEMRKFDSKEALLAHLAKTEMQLAGL